MKTKKIKRVHCIPDYNTMTDEEILKDLNHVIVKLKHRQYAPHIRHQDQNMIPIRVYNPKNDADLENLETFNVKTKALIDMLIHKKREFQKNKIDREEIYNYFVVFTYNLGYVETVQVSEYLYALCLTDTVCTSF